MSVGAFLDELQATGISITREGDNLRVRALPGISLALYTDRVRERKPSLLAALALQEHIVAAATVDPAEFNRTEYDRLWALWYAQEKQS